MTHTIYELTLIVVNVYSLSLIRWKANNNVYIKFVHRVSKKNDNDVAHYNFNAH